jgi:hypothetical protein
MIFADRIARMQYVDYAKGEATGFLRFDVPEDAQKLRAAAVIEPEGGLTIANHLITFEALEGTVQWFDHNGFLCFDYPRFMCPVFLQHLLVCLLSLGLTSSPCSNTCRRG